MRHITRPEPDPRHAVRLANRWAGHLQCARPQQVRGRGRSQVPGSREGEVKTSEWPQPRRRRVLSSARKKPQTRARCEVHQMQFFRLFGRPDVSTALHHLSHHSRALISFMASAPPAIARRVSPPTATPNPPVHRLPRFVFFLRFKLAP